MVTGNLATEDLDSRLTAERKRVREVSSVSGSPSTLPREAPARRGWGFGGQRPGWAETEDLMESLAALAPDLLCVPAETC